MTEEEIELLAEKISAKLNIRSKADTDLIAAQDVALARAQNIEADLNRKVSELRTALLVSESLLTRLVLFNGDPRIILVEPSTNSVLSHLGLVLARTSDVRTQ